uniref:Ion_trans_2 domain-containing protein n=1 Tax=Caenorhabditis tropicalis TaxID=1561998 RepID=A0A1I7UPU0_9PELO
MGTSELSPKFQYAFRRCLFYTFVLVAWLFIGMILFPALCTPAVKQDDNEAGIFRLDAKRSDLLNVLWAETITNGEDDWSELADQKLELYEKGTTLWIVTIVYIFISAVIYDIVEGGSDDVPFIEAIFSIFLQFTTVGEVDNEFHGILPYCIVVLGLALITALYQEMQQNIERFIHPFEYSFNRLCGTVERYIGEKSEEKKSIASTTIDEENEDELSDYE